MPITAIIEITKKQAEVLGHTLGIAVYDAKLSDNKKAKFLPDEFYRNYFCSGTEKHHDYSTLSALETMGLMQRWNQYDQLYFAVTKKGILEFREWFIINITDTYKAPPKAKQTYLDYLHADGCESFPEFIGIQLPIIDYCYDSGLWQYKSTKYPGVDGAWEYTKLKARASYKEALKKFKAS